MSPSSSHGDEASAKSSETLAVCQPSCFYLVVNVHIASVKAYVTNLQKNNLRKDTAFDSLLTPATNSVLPTGHHIFTLLVFPRNHFKFNAGVSHSMVSMGKTKWFTLSIAAAKCFAIIGNSERKVN